VQVNRPTALMNTLAGVVRAIRFGGRSLARRPRRGVSILEVLFAIAVTTIGLLGALAVFPVASAQARKGRISDAMAVAGMSAAHDFDVREMRRPAMWSAWNTNTNKWFSPWQSWQVFNLGDTTNGTNWFGGAYAFCIDPRFVAINDDTNANRIAASRFPISGTTDGVGMGRVSLTGGTAQLPVPLPYDPANPPPLPAVRNPIGRALSEALFVFDDDLTAERPEDRSYNAVQLFDSISGAAYKRQSDGHMSWMATLVPKLDQVNSGFGDSYTLSIVVFYDRPLATVSDGFEGEREVYVDSFPGSGVTGGEVLLSASSAAALDLKPNDWLMLSGRSITTNRPMFRWYRVMDVEPEAAAGGSQGFQKYVTLFGQDWSTGMLDATPRYNRAVIAEGVVGVYEKTVRLDMSP
jgi:hypothetical protein